MLQAGISAIPVPGASLSSASPATLTHTPETTTTTTTRSTPATTPTTSSTQTPQRFYRLKNHEPTTTPPNPTTTPAHLIETTRRTALYTLTLCRNVITILELTRLRKSRIGLLHWLEFWNRYYGRRFGRALAAHVTQALGRVDALFRGVAADLHQLTQRVQHAVATALHTEHEILGLLERMEDEVGVRRRRRRKKAQAILGSMRARLEAIPVKVSDELLDDLKRGVFALDVYCDYYPGDEGGTGSSAGVGEDGAWTETRYITRRPLSIGMGGNYTP
ncbi:hypothetical protein BO82DRAFT_392167 [Aspergillus uvarum CBS 121591]|uniref:Uncharacterized protein n=1 Tax=Aspergillus uvarum CBS 121591 TaxID=1448315 RepID=A0A319C8V6_9EURO|nr:hypothetical protein BO82DRAFT_392167 [Aspergillus uvarum CBS 121591]PYH81674.1 hypothetical protein BO82DRAFT_392167 [Aspergillus uvarum CBS 121591]